MENTVVVMWLKLIHHGLPSLVKQRYGTELRHKTLASIKPEISQALTSLIDELHSVEESKAMRTVTPSRFQHKPRQSKQCTLCKAAGRLDAFSHFLSACPHLPAGDRRAVARSRLVPGEESEDYISEPDINQHQDTHNALLDPPSAST